MENKREKDACVFHITGGNNQIMPNVTEVVQNFYGDQFGEAAMKEGQPGEGDKKVRLSDSEASEDVEPDSLAIAEGELRIYYADDVSLKAFIVRIGACKDATELANLVVNDMMEHTILNGVIAVKAHFIESLLVFAHFTKGSSVSNVRQQIRKKTIAVSGAGKDRVESIRGR